MWSWGEANPVPRAYPLLPILKGKVLERDCGEGKTCEWFCIYCRLADKMALVFFKTNPAAPEYIYHKTEANVNYLWHSSMNCTVFSFSGIPIFRASKGNENLVRKIEWLEKTGVKSQCSTEEGVGHLIRVIGRFEKSRFLFTSAISKVA